MPNLARPISQRRRVQATGCFERLESRQLLAALQAGDANQDLYFDEAVYSTVGSGAAAVQYDGTYKLVYLGFPYEAIMSASMRAQVMEAVLDFFGSGSGFSGWKMY